jgi:hypothetical protein
MIDEHECSEEQLHSCDETALHYKMLPTKFLAINKSAEKYSMKINKERVTLLFCANTTGSHKLKPLCWKKLKSSMFQIHKHDILPVIYKSSKNVKMTNDILIL